MIMKRYNPSQIEPKWQSYWAETNTYAAVDNDSRAKTYVSGMFPYPSGAGMHAGHAFSYTIVDTIARFERAQGRNVLNPIGWDTFGLPAENYAIKTGTSPAVATATNIANFKTQFKRLGISIDWNREINTSDPEYYRWTQWIFTKLFERGLAYQKTSPQWWCPVDKTVLANEQVEAGRCWRCGTAVVKKQMEQWFFRITTYADALLDGLDDLQWPQKIKSAQANWIGKSRGADIEFPVVGVNETVTVFTTRPDTIFGASFIVLAPEHELVSKLTTDYHRESINAYVNNASKKSDIERMSESKGKTGVFTGRHAVNPGTGQQIPIWIADYVLSGYGTGAVMAVPAHDERDNEFANRYDLPIISVIESSDNDGITVYNGEGALQNSGAFDGMQSSEAREQIVAWLEREGIGHSKTTYKMRDWLISRQRYWGAPIPIIHCPDHGAVSVPNDQLPVRLPDVKDFAPKGDGKSALARDEAWVNTTCPTCGQPARRETDTMDGYACSSWYLLRYTDPKDSVAAWNSTITNYWSPVDYYVGGDHAVAHLLYVRFWTHVFKDMGLTDFSEPVKKLIYHGYINASDGTKMSKSKGNVVDPLDVIDQGYGADALRTYVLFMGPIELDAPWDSKGIAGVYRFLNRVWVLVQEYLDANDQPKDDIDKNIQKVMHQTIKQTTRDFHQQSFNTAIARLMEYTNELYKFKTNGFTASNWSEAVTTIIKLLSPLAPHMSAELWEQLGNTISLESAGWPMWENALLVSDTMKIIVQVNGKVRASLTVDATADQASIQTTALRDANVMKFMNGREPKKVIYVPKRLLNIVI